MNKVQDIISNTIDYFILTCIPDHFLNLDIGNYIGQIINVHFIRISKYVLVPCPFMDPK